MYKFIYIISISRYYVYNISLCVCVQIHTYVCVTYDLGKGKIHLD